MKRYSYMILIFMAALFLSITAFGGCPKYCNLVPWSHLSSNEVARVMRAVKPNGFCPESVGECECPKDVIKHKDGRLTIVCGSAMWFDKLEDK